jgi:hypothetical protein
MQGKSNAAAANLAPHLAARRGRLTWSGVNSILDGLPKHGGSNWPCDVIFLTAAFFEKDAAMARDEDDDLYDEEFDFVDEDDDDGDADDSDVPRSRESDVSDEPELADEPANGERSRRDRGELGFSDDEPVDEYGRPEPAANYVVHIYEQKKFKRTIDRPFTPEDAEAFATEYNRTSKPYHRVAVAGKNDAKPKKALE